MAYFISISQFFSTDSYLVELTDFVYRGTDEGFHTGMIIVDSEKAFDTLDHTILLQKIESVGFKESVIKWFQSYLSNRKSFVALEDIFADAGLINCGVPQGSILGSLLFLMHVNDLPQALNETGSYIVRKGVKTTPISKAPLLILGNAPISENFRTPPPPSPPSARLSK